MEGWSRFWTAECRAVKPPACAAFNRRSGVEQTGENRGTAFGDAAGRGGMQGQVAHVVHRADERVRAALEQQFDAFQMAEMRGQMQRRPAARAGGVDGGGIGFERLRQGGAVAGHGGFPVAHWGLV